MQRSFQFSYEVFDSIAALNDSDANLLNCAKEITAKAYAPYSNFQVGSAAMLENGEVVVGTNQENASFPVGICSERVLLSTISSLFPDMPIHTIAISYTNKNGVSHSPISPCGLCRQSLLEYQKRTKKSIRLILSGMDGEIFVIEDASMLLPLSFGGKDLE